MSQMREYGAALFRAGTIVPLLDDPLWTRVRGTLAQEPIIDSILVIHI